jgi:hypothetical protein
MDADAGALIATMQARVDAVMQRLSTLEASSALSGSQTLPTDELLAVKTPADLHSSCSNGESQHTGSGTGTGMLSGPGTSSLLLVAESQQAQQADSQGEEVCNQTDAEWLHKDAAAELISLADSFDLTPEGVHAWCLSLFDCCQHVRPIAPPAGLHKTLPTVHMLTPPLWPPPHYTGWITPAPCQNAVIEPTASADASSSDRSKLRAEVLVAIKGDAAAQQTISAAVGWAEDRGCGCCRDEYVQHIR